MTTIEHEPMTVTPATVAPPTTPDELGNDDARPRVDGPLKVTGTAPYAYEQPADNPGYLYPLISDVAQGRITAINTSHAEELPGVLLVMTHKNAPKLRIKILKELRILQSDQIDHRGQFIGAVVAETPEVARHAASLVEVSYDEQPADVEFDPAHPDTSVPKRSGQYERGDVDGALATSTHTIDATYAMSGQYHNPIEPHAVTAIWHRVNRLDPRATRLTLYDANQGPAVHVALLAPAFGILPNQLEIISPYVGGSFGTKGFPHPHIVLTVMAAKLLGQRPVKYAMTRQQMFRTVGYRPTSQQQVRLAADADGKLTAIEHQSWAPTAKTFNYVESSASVSKALYASPNCRTIRHGVKQDIAPGTFMRAPGEYSGMFALETAMDELAIELALDPIELRVRNEPRVDPDSGKPFSTRNLVACLTEGAERFGWSARTGPGEHVDGEWLVGLGMASATFPNAHVVPSRAQISYKNGRYTVALQSSDVGTGAYTVLPQIAAKALGVSVDIVDISMGRTGLPLAAIGGGSQGTYEWGNAITAAAEKFRRKHGETPSDGASAKTAGRLPKGASGYSRHAFGATFCQVRVSQVTGETRVDRMLGMYAAGKIINPRTARSQFIGSMTMGISGALHEEAYLDSRFGHVVNGDLAGYHIASHADIHDIEAAWVDEFDPWFGATGAKGIGEIGIVGVPAAIGNAIFNASGVRMRELPFTPDKLIEALEAKRVSP